MWPAVCPRRERQAGSRPSLRPAGGSTDVAAFTGKRQSWVGEDSVDTGAPPKKHEGENSQAHKSRRGRQRQQPTTLSNQSRNLLLMHGWIRSALLPTHDKVNGKKKHETSPADMVRRFLRGDLRRVQHPLDGVHHHLRFREAPYAPVQQRRHAKKTGFRAPSMRKTSGERAERDN